MSIKNILIVAPEAPVLRQMTMQFLRKPDLRLLCFGKVEGADEEPLLQMLFLTEQGHLESRDCRETAVDEIWHTANLSDSIDECKNKTARALLFAKRQRIPILHYLSVSTVAALRRKPYSNGIPPSNNDEQKHLMNEITIERSGCKFRIYRLPLSPEALFHSASGWAQFAQGLTRFKFEIEDRIPAYFTAQPLRLCLPEAGTIDIARTDHIVQTIEQILRSGKDGPCFHLCTPRRLPVKECLQMLAESAGIDLRIVASHEQQNYVDRLFGSRMERCLRHLECSTHATAEDFDSFLAGQPWFSVPSILPQEFIVGCPYKSHRSLMQAGDWKSSLEQKHVLLPDGSVLNYYIGGQGQQTLVLLNAYGQSFRSWEKFIQAVSTQLRIVLWTSRGNDGETIGLRAANLLSVHANDLERVLEQEKIESCTLLAWCSGPKLALEYYQHYPGRISSMVFVAASFKGLQQHKVLETDYEKNLEPLLEAVEKYPETADVVLEYLKGVLLAQGKEAPRIDELAAMSDRDLQQALSMVNVSLQELVLHPFHAVNVVAYARQMCNFWKHDFIAGLDKVMVPVLFVGGDCDRIASQAIAKVVAGMMPQARYLEIKGGTHYIHYDQWDLLAEIAEQIVDSGAALNSEHHERRWAKRTLTSAGRQN